MEEVVEDSSGEVEPSRHPKRGKGILSKARGRREGEGLKCVGGEGNEGGGRLGLGRFV
jgi:hypothetical protein